MCGEFLYVKFEAEMTCNGRILFYSDAIDVAFLEPFGDVVLVGDDYVEQLKVDGYQFEFLPERLEIVIPFEFVARLDFLGEQYAVYRYEWCYISFDNNETVYISDGLDDLMTQIVGGSF